MKGKVFVSQIDIATAIMEKIAEQNPGYCTSARQYNSIFKAATMVCEALSTPDTRSVAGEGIEAWLKSDDVGSSSKFMASVLSQSHGISAEYAHPADPSDFIRCRKLLLAEPSLTEHIHLMAPKSSVWLNLVENWNSLCHLMDSECSEWASKDASYPKTYELMKKLGC